MTSNRSSSGTEPDLAARVQRFNYIRDFWRSQECLAPYPYMDVFQSASESDDCSSGESPHLPPPPQRLPPPPQRRLIVSWPQAEREGSRGGSVSGGMARQNQVPNASTVQWLRKHNRESKFTDHPHCTCETDICTSIEDLRRKSQPVPLRRPRPRQLSTSVAAVYEKSSEVTTVIESASCGFHSYAECGSSCPQGGGDSTMKEDVSNFNTNTDVLTLTPLPSISPPPKDHQCQRRIFLILAIFCVVFVTTSALCSLWNHTWQNPQPPGRGQSGAPSPFYPSSSLWMSMADPDRAPQQPAGCDWDCLKLLLN